MKKKVTVLLVGLMMLVGAGSAYAEEQVPVVPPVSEAAVMDELDETAMQVKKIEVLKQFRDELHEINELRVDRLESKIQIVKQQDKILDLIIKARENGDKEKLKEVDDGKGFLPREEKRVFERFYKGEQGGTGIGLAITRAIVEGHGGSVEAFQGNPSGAVIRIIFPLKHDQV